MKKRLLLEIITSDSKSPVSDFISQLNTKFKTKIVTQFTLLQDCKHHLQPPLVKAIRHSKYKGLYELRTRLNQTMSRIIFCFDNNDNIILLHGFLKKHNRSIEQALEIARARQLALDSKKVYTSIISSRRQA